LLISRCMMYVTQVWWWLRINIIIADLKMHDVCYTGVMMATNQHYLVQVQIKIFLCLRHWLYQFPRQMIWAPVFGRVMVELWATSVVSLPVAKLLCSIRTVDVFLKLLIWTWRHQSNCSFTWLVSEVNWVNYFLIKLSS